MPCLTVYLAYPNSPHSLLYSFTQIEPEGTKLLANGLISCTNLCKLFIDNNNIGDVGAAAIATVIEKCHQLQLLDVSSNDIGDVGARESPEKQWNPL